MVNAIHAIENEETFVFDICANHGLVFHNVKRCTWFVQMVAREMVGKW